MRLNGKCPLGRIPVLCGLQTVVLLTALISGCGRTRIPAAPAADNTVLDLVAGWRLRVVAPVLNDPSQPSTLSLSSDGPLGFTVKSTPNLKGFETQYLAVGGAKTRVQLTLTQATLTVNGHAQVEDHPLKTYFPLPPGKLQIRLIYLTRSTDSAHDMAVVYARNRSTLTELAERVTRDPNVCGSEPNACLWIPSTVAVLAQRLTAANSWEPVQ